MTQFEQQGQIVVGQQQNANQITNINPSAWTPPVMLPPRAQSFVGREEEIDWLLRQLKDTAGKMLALCGPGGMGKTALAAEVLSRLVAQSDWLTRFPGGIFYHSFYVSPSLSVAYERLARVFGEEPGGDPRSAALHAVSHRRAVLVFDGVECLPDALPLRELVGANVVFVLSRRQSDAPDLAHRRVLSVLTLDEGVTLLQELAGPRATDRRSSEQLVKRIGGYPLALQLIGSYLSSYQEEVADYLAWYEQEGLATMHFGEHQVQSVPLLLRRSYEVLSQEGQEVFAVLGLLAPAPFPRELMQGIMASPERAVRKALGSLVNVGVLRRAGQDYEVSHPLVHTFATERVCSQERAAGAQLVTAWRERLLETLAAHFEQSDRYDRVGFACWSPHVLSLLFAQALRAEGVLRAANLFYNAGAHASTQSKHAEAESLYQRALRIWEQSLGEVHPLVAYSLNGLANLYKEQGKYGEAEPLFQRTLRIWEQSLGPEHDLVAHSLNNLANLYFEQGKHAEAEPLYQRALRIWERSLGPDHPEVATALTNLANLYYEQGKHVEAESLYQRALRIWEQSLGEVHPLVAYSLNGLANLYKEQGKYGEAEPLFQRALRIKEQSLGPDHPLVASALSNLAILYFEQGKYAEAEPLYQRAFGIFEQQLGADHPYTLKARNNYASLLRAMGRTEEAVSMESE